MDLKLDEISKYYSTLDTALNSYNIYLKQYSEVSSIRNRREKQNLMEKQMVIVRELLKKIQSDCLDRLDPEIEGIFEREKSQLMNSTNSYDLTHIAISVIVMLGVLYFTMNAMICLVSFLFIYMLLSLKKYFSNDYEYFKLENSELYSWYFGQVEVIRHVLEALTEKRIVDPILIKRVGILNLKEILERHKK